MKPTGAFYAIFCKEGDSVLPDFASRYWSTEERSVIVSSVHTRTVSPPTSEPFCPSRRRKLMLDYDIFDIRYIEYGVLFLSSCVAAYTRWRWRRPTVRVDADVSQSMSLQPSYPTNGTYSRNCTNCATQNYNVVKKIATFYRHCDCSHLTTLSHWLVCELVQHTKAVIYCILTIFCIYCTSWYVTKISTSPAICCCTTLWKLKTKNVANFDSFFNKLLPYS